MSIKEKAKTIYDSIVNLSHYDEDIPYTVEDGKEIVELTKLLVAIIKAQEDMMDKMNATLLSFDKLLDSQNDKNLFTVPSSDPSFEKIIDLLMPAKTK